MKRISSVVILLLFLLGCNSEEDHLQPGMALRERLMEQSCSFTVEIIADYVDRTYTFSMGCSSDKDGNVSFIVLAPESIGGIGGKLTGSSGFLTFDDTALAFPLLAEGEVSPVSAPWLLMNTLRSGYMVSAGHDNSGTRLTIHDSYAEDALQLDIWLDDDELPKYCEILWQGRRVLSLHIKEFAFV